MKSTWKTVALAVIVIGLCSGLIAYTMTNQPSAELWGYQGSIKTVDHNSFAFESAHQDFSLRATWMTEISSPTAHALIQERLIEYNALFERQRVGYQGQHTEFISCDPGMKPSLDYREVQNGELHLVQGYSNDRLTPGICDQESASKRYVGGMLYCTNRKTLFQFDFFTGRDRETPINNFVNRIRCP